MARSKPSIVNKKGMITIPAEYRKKYNLLEGAKISIVDINGHLEIIPVLPIDELRKRRAEEYVDAIEEDRKEELELENNE